jgi:hypothetical protein
MNNMMGVRDYEHILNELGQFYVHLRKDCLTECANLLDTHEVTLAEKNCLENCTRKLNHAFTHFNKMAFRNLDKVNSLNDEVLIKKY